MLKTIIKMMINLIIKIFVIKIIIIKDFILRIIDVNKDNIYTKIALIK